MVEHFYNIIRLQFLTLFCNYSNFIWNTRRWRNIESICLRKNYSPICKVRRKQLPIPDIFFRLLNLNTRWFRLREKCGLYSRHNLMLVNNFDTLSCFTRRQVWNTDKHCKCNLSIKLILLREQCRSISWTNNTEEYRR